MVDVARAAGVSAMTVSRALKGDPVVTESTRRKILRVVEELGYVIDLTAAHLSSQRSGFVSVLVPTGNNSNFNATVEGITEVMEANQKHILIGYTHYSLKREEHLIETMLQRRPEGIIITGAVHTDSSRNMLEQADVPVIEVWDLPESPISHVVGFSNSVTIETMMQHLVAKGYKNIVFVGSKNTEDIRGNDRRLGYEKAATELGLENRELILDAPPPVSSKDGAVALDSLLQRWPDTDAVVCVSDLIAFGIIMECHRRNISVPDQLAVSGFGDFELSKQCWPSITTISVSSREIGSKAGQLMLDAIDASGKNEEFPPQCLRTSHSIVEREST